MSKIEEAINDITLLRDNIKKELSVDSILEMFFATTISEITTVYRKLLEDHSAGDKSPSQMYTESITTMEQIGPHLNKVKEEVGKYLQGKLSKASAYDDCIEILKKN